MTWRIRNKERTRKIVLRSDSLRFTIYFAYNTLQNFLTQIFEQLVFAHLGFYFLFILNFVMCVLSLLTGSLPAIVCRKKLIANGASIIGVFAASCLVPVYCNYFEASATSFKILLLLLHLEVTPVHILVHILVVPLFPYNSLVKMHSSLLIKNSA